MQALGIELSLVQAILDGTKTIEGVPGTPPFLKVRVGDTLSIREDVYKEGELTVSHEHAAQVRVAQLLYFETFAEMMETLGYQSAIPYATSIETALKVYRGLYAAEQEKEWGVVAIRFELIPA